MKTEEYLRNIEQRRGDLCKKTDAIRKRYVVDVTMVMSTMMQAPENSKLVATPMFNVVTQVARDEGGQ